MIRLSRLFRLALCVLLGACCCLSACGTGGISEGSSAPEPSGSGEESVPEEGSNTSGPSGGESSIAGGGYALVSNGAPYTLSVKPASDSGFLTDGKINDLQLDTDGVLFCNSASFDAEIDLGETVDGLKRFDLWIMRSSATSDIREISVSVAGEDKQYASVTSASSEAHPPTAMGRIHLLRAECEKGVRGRYVKLHIRTAGGSRAALAEAAVYKAYDVSFLPEIEQASPRYTKIPKGTMVPHVTYSMITTMSLAGADEEMAETYFDTLQEAGIEGLIILHGAAADGSVPATATLDLLFKQADKRGMKIYMGFNGADDIYGQTDAFLTANAKAMNTLYTRYRTTYPDVFCGWYMTPEFSNGDYAARNRETADILNGVIANLEALDPSLPLMLSPYCTSWGGSPAQLKTDLLKLFSAVRFRSIDIYCPQDGVGCGYVSEDSAGDYLAAAAGVCDSRGIRFWANLENFKLKASVPDGDEDIPAPVSRFVKQLWTAVRYAEEFVTFTYEAYMPEYFSNYTIYNDSDAYHHAYIEYLNTGKAPAETEPPQVSLHTDGNLVTVSYPTPTYETSYVRVVSGSAGRWFSRRLLQTSGGMTYLTFRNESPGEDLTVTVFDLSAQSSGPKTFGPDGEPKKSSGKVDRSKPFYNAAAGASYTTTKPSHSNGDNGGELTDGQHGKADFFDPAWLGHNGMTFEIVIDLGKTIDRIGDIRMEVLGGGYGAVYEPRKFTVSVSLDGSTYTEVGTKECTDENTGAQYIKTAELSFEEYVSARYVKIDVTVFGWFFTDEIEVIAYDA